MNTHVVVAGVHQNILRALEDNDNRDWVVSAMSDHLVHPVEY